MNLVKLLGSQGKSGSIPFRVIKCALCVPNLRVKQGSLKNRTHSLIRIGIIIILERSHYAGIVLPIVGGSQKAP